MRAIPSPAESTVPVSATSTRAVRPPSCSLMMRVISSARISMTPLLFGSLVLDEPRAQGTEAAAHGAVVRLAAEADEEAPEDLGFHACPEVDGEPRPLPKRLRQGRLLGGREGERRDRLRGHESPLLVPDLGIGFGDPAQEGQTIP